MVLFSCPIQTKGEKYYVKYKRQTTNVQISGFR